MNMTRSQLFNLCPVFLIATSFLWRISAQETPPSTPDNLAVARDFLHTMYPQLSGKNYFTTLETTLYYDKQTDPLGGRLQLSIGEGPKGRVLYTVNGCQAVPIAPQPPAPNGALPSSRRAIVSPGLLHLNSSCRQDSILARRGAYSNSKLVALPQAMLPRRPHTRS
jgi:hypothetical protein